MQERRSEGRGKGKAGRGTHALLLAAAVFAFCIVPASVFPLPASRSLGVAAQSAAVAPSDTMAFYKALDLEAAGKYREAVPLFRMALHTSAAINALLGLERVYAELGWADSLVAPLDTLIAASPKEETYPHRPAANIANRGTHRRLAEGVRDVDPRHARQRSAVPRVRAAAVAEEPIRLRRTASCRARIRRSVRRRICSSSWRRRAPRRGNGSSRRRRGVMRCSRRTISSRPPHTRSRRRRRRRAWRCEKCFWRCRSKYRRGVRLPIWKPRGVRPPTDGTRSRICRRTARLPTRGRSLPSARNRKTAG